MSHRFEDEDEEEDELQRILEGRDVEDIDDEEDYNSDNNFVNNDNHSVNDYFYDERHDKKTNRSHEINSIKRTKDRKQTNSLSKNKVSNKVREENNYDFDLDSNQNNEQNSGSNEEKIEENKNKVEVKVRRIVSRPQPKLNADKLMTKTGIAQLPELFQNVKFGGKGRELNDLNLLLFKLEHWAHRLFPSLTFDDFIEKVEQIGSKRPLKTFVSKIRYDLPLNLDPEEEVVEMESEDEPQTIPDNNKIFDAIVAKHTPNIDFHTNHIFNSQIINQQIQTQNKELDFEMNAFNGNQEKEVNFQSINNEREVNFEMTNNLEDMNDLLSEDEIIRQLNSND